MAEEAARWRRIYETGKEEALSSGSGSGRRELGLHFDRLPQSYLLQMSMSAEDVLLHRRILADADTKKRPVVHARFLQLAPVTVDYGGGGDLDQAQPPLPELRSFLHEIIFASRDKPKLLSQLSALTSAVGLNIREAHVFTTADGFSLSIFLVDGWYQEEAEGLLKAIKEKHADKCIYVCLDWSMHAENGDKLHLETASR